MDEQPKPENVTPTDSWEFDNWNPCQLDAKNHIQLSDTDQGQKVQVFLNSTEELAIHADRDQWGTWITFQIGDKGFTVAQEDGTMSFIDALIASLNSLKNITDLDTTPPTHTVITEAISDETTPIG